MRTTLQWLRGLPRILLPFPCHRRVQRGGVCLSGLGVGPGGPKESEDHPSHRGTHIAVMLYFSKSVHMTFVQLTVFFQKLMHFLSLSPL